MKKTFLGLLLLFFMLFIEACTYRHYVKLFNFTGMPIYINTYKNTTWENGEWKLYADRLHIPQNKNVRKSFKVVSIVGLVYLIQATDEENKVIYEKIFDYWTLKDDSFRIYIYDMRLRPIEIGEKRRGLQRDHP